MVTKEPRVSGTTSEIYKMKRERQVVEDLDDATYLYPSALTHATSPARLSGVNHCDINVIQGVNEDNEAAF